MKWHLPRLKGFKAWWLLAPEPGVAADPSAGFRRTERLRGKEFENVVTEMADMVSHMPGPNGAKARNAFISMAQKLGGALMARQSAALSKRVDLWPRLGEIACPSLMLWGREDKFSPAADGLKMSTALLHGRYAEISECGHFPSLEAPEETADILLHWLQDSQIYLRLMRYSAMASTSACGSFAMLACTWPMPPEDMFS